MSSVQSDMVAKPISLRSVKPETVGGINAYYQYYAPVTLSLLEGQVHAYSEFFREPLQDIVKSDLLIKHRGQFETQVVVELPQFAKQLLMGEAHAALSDAYICQDLDDDWVWEAACGKLLDSLEQQLDIIATLIGPEDTAQALDPSTANLKEKTALGFTLDFEEHSSVSGQLLVDDEALQYFARQVSPLPPLFNPRIKVSCPVIAAETELPGRFANELQPGDLIFPTKGQLLKDKIILSIPNVTRLICSLISKEEGNLTMRIDEREDERDEPNPDSPVDGNYPHYTEQFDEGDSNMESDEFSETSTTPVKSEGPVAETAKAEKTHMEETDDAISPNAVPIPLTFIVGRVEKLVSEIATLSVGQIVILNSDLSAPVSIVANGRWLGTGSLVEVKNKLAVQITEWGG